MAAAAASAAAPWRNVHHSHLLKPEFRRAAGEFRRAVLRLIPMGFVVSEKKTKKRMKMLLKIIIKHIF